MASLSCLEMVAAVCAEQALPVPDTLFGSSIDSQPLQLRALLNQELNEQRTWPDVYPTLLIRQHTFTTTATEIQPANAVPDDLDHFVDSSMWDRTLTRPVVGPISPQLWQAWKARPVLTSVVFGYILMGNDFYTAPTPPAGDTIAYNYISKLSVYASGDTLPTQELFEADTDTCIFDTQVMERGLRWRFLRAKGLDYAQEYAAWVNSLQIWMSRQGGMPRISMAGSYNDWLAGPFVPSFSFPGP